MNHPTSKLISFFLAAMLAGYIISYAIMAFLLQAPFHRYGLGNLTVVALLVAILLTFWLDKPLSLGLFKWPTSKPK